MNDPLPVLRDGVNPGWEFPIVDPRAATAGDSMAVEGFEFADAGVPGAQQASGREDMKARLPMPVRWLYVLRDGSLATPSSAADGKVTFSGDIRPTRDNPVVGRVAFWADDDSTKVNINTATEGTGWSVPRANTQTERDAAAKMPVRNEFSRYPGHPAMTSLSPVFQAFGPDFIVTPWMTGATRAERLKAYHSLSPRIAWGGTQGGTAAGRPSGASSATKLIMQCVASRSRPLLRSRAITSTAKCMLLLPVRINLQRTTTMSPISIGLTNWIPPTATVTQYWPLQPTAAA